MHRSELQVRSACGQSWDEMRGGARRRFCEACQHDVVNLSALTEREAAALVARAGAERLCVRYVSDREGRVRFRAEPSEAAGLRGHVAAGALVALARTAAPLIPVSALLPACAATLAPDLPAPDLPAPSLAPPSLALPAPAPPAPPAPEPAPRPQPTTTESSITDPTLGSAGAIVVLVRDRDRRVPLVGAAVSVSSAALKRNLVAVTGEDGKIVFKGLPPADYTIEIDVGIYGPYARSTKVSAGHASTLEVGLVEDPEGMTTVGEIVAAPTVTVTHSSQQGVHLDQSFVSRLPLR